MSNKHINKQVTTIHLYMNIYIYPYIPYFMNEYNRIQNKVGFLLYKTKQTRKKTVIIR